eukprot:g15416.t1
MKGKVFLMAGDARQIGPVVDFGGEAETYQASIMSSKFYRDNVQTVDSRALALSLVDVVRRLRDHAPSTDDDEEAAPGDAPTTKTARNRRRRDDDDDDGDVDDLDFGHPLTV